MPIYGTHTKRIATIAGGYYEIARSTWESSCNAPFEKELSVRHGKLLAAIMNMSFCVELCFKAQLPYGTQGHQLNDLFNKLMPEEQKELIDYVTEEHKGRKGEHNKCDTEADFRALLQDCSENFIQARYIFEEQKGNIYMPYWFLECLARNMLFTMGILDPSQV